MITPKQLKGAVLVLAGLILTLVGACFHLNVHAQGQNFGPPVISSCGTLVACSNTALVSPKIIFGTAALSSGSPSTAVITGISPAFSSTTSYKCHAQDVTTIASNVNVVTYTSGASFTINGPNTVTDTVNYICVGN